MIKNSKIGGYNVLSLFDGISCGHIALERAGITVNNYYASEIDKYAIQITQKNYPNTIQLGDINNIDFSQFIGKIDIIIGGSPCQDLSIAKANREGLSGKRSCLFYKFIEAIRIIKPKYFLLENNYSMTNEAKDIITKEMGIEPIMINSNLFSAQNRKRLYWTNIPIAELPEKCDIKLQDILESGVVDRNKSLCLTRRYAGFVGSQSYLCRRYFGKSMGQAVFNGNLDDIKIIKDKWQENNYFSDEELERKVIRPMTCLECERLQTLPDNYTNCIDSEIARKETIGNGWTVDVIAHIFKGLKNNV